MLVITGLTAVLFEDIGTDHGGAGRTQDTLIPWCAAVAPRFSCPPYRNELFDSGEEVDWTFSQANEVDVSGTGDDDE